jgi:hypothetical protein
MDHPVRFERIRISRLKKKENRLINNNRYRMNMDEETGNTLMAANTSRSFSSSMIKVNINAGNMAVTRQILARMTIL